MTHQDALGAQIMQEVKRYDDGMGCTRRQLVDNILVLISQASRASVAAPPPDAAIFTDDELEYLYLQTDVDADPDLFRGIEKKIRRQIARYREFDRNKNMNRLVFSEEESNATAAAPTNAACPKCGGTKPTCCSCPSPVAATVDAETKAKEIADYLFTNGFGDKGDHLNLYRNGDVYLGGWNEDSVVRGIVSYLNDYTAQSAPSDSSIQATARHYFCSCGGALTAEEYIEHYFEKGHDQGDLPTLIRAAAAEIVEGIRRFNELGERDVMLPPVENVAAILSKHLGSGTRVYCAGCSEAGGADRAIYHAPPVCAATPTSTEESEGRKLNYVTE